MIIVDHNHPTIKAIRSNPKFAPHKYNGAYYYSVEIGKYFIPTIKTNRNWVTINVKSLAPRHAIVFAHNNVHLEWYKKYQGKDAILVCGMPETAERLKIYGKTIYLPLSVDVEEVARFRTDKTKDVCFCGRNEKRTSAVPDDVPSLEGMPRDMLLQELAKYRRAYAVDRCAIEAKILGCEVLNYGYNYGVQHPADFWQIIDSRDAAKMLQEALNQIDGTEEQKKSTQRKRKPTQEVPGKA